MPLAKRLSFRWVVLFNKPLLAGVLMSVSYVQFTKVLAQELLPLKIRVNQIAVSLSFLLPYQIIQAYLTYSARYLPFRDDCW